MMCRCDHPIEDHMRPSGRLTSCCELGCLCASFEEFNDDEM